jgi:Phage integrase, N-terminal SAM-like domain
MKGHIRRRGKSSWAVVIFLGRDPSGKQHRKWHAVHGNRKDAQRELARLLNEMSTGAYVEPARMSVGEYLDRWLADYAKAKVAAKTYERYVEMVEGHIKPALGSYLLPKLAPLHVQGFYTRALAQGRKDGKGGLSAQSVVHFHRLLHKAFAQAIKWQLLAAVKFSVCDGGMSISRPAPSRSSSRSNRQKRACGSSRPRRTAAGG